eukprot:TRINITY_DN29945_c0_g1_i1.p2 TRINITY_DN29945_c0_g1~~TRINITY_DN29945_c0_g1_i1.p2  ORF type:complete len:236 (+),score=15.99 TRINITY_DN29945_c0_g1_i1:30-710(+)
MATLSGVAAPVASAAAHSAVRGISQAIGKSTDSARLNTLASSQSPSHSDINWVDFNYPPVLRLIHFNLEELPSSHVGLARCFHITFQLTVFTCALGFVNSIVLLASVQAKAVWLLQSAIHAVVLPSAALLVFYSGYRGIAEPDSQLVARFKTLQPVLAVVYFLLAVVPWGCINGLAKLGSTQGSMYWTVVIVLESSLWLGNCALAAWNCVRLSRFDPHKTVPSMRL